MRIAARPALAVLIGALLAAGCAAAAPAAPDAGVTIAAGRSGGKTWTVKASITHLDPREVGTCVTLTVAGSPAASGCASLVTRVPPGAPPGFPHGVGGHAVACARTAQRGFVFGPVVASARVVTIELSSGAKIRTPARRSPTGLPKSVRWVVATFPCGPLPGSIVARDAGGRVVGSFAL